MIDLRKRNLLTLLDFSADEITYMLDLAARLKADKYLGKEKKLLTGKNIVLLFEKDSTRTRCAFEVAAHDQGAQVTYLGPTGSQMGKKESVKVPPVCWDECMTESSTEVTGNGLYGCWPSFRAFRSGTASPRNFIRRRRWPDMLTMREHCPKPLSEVKFCFLGDAHNNVATR